MRATTCKYPASHAISCPKRNKHSFGVCVQSIDGEYAAWYAAVRQRDKGVCTALEGTSACRTGVHPRRLAWRPGGEHARVSASVQASMLPTPFAAMQQAELGVHLGLHMLSEVLGQSIKLLHCPCRGCDHRRSFFRWVAEGCRGLTRRPLYAFAQAAISELHRLQIYFTLLFSSSMMWLETCHWSAPSPGRVFLRSSLPHLRVS